MFDFLNFFLARFYLEKKTSIRNYNSASITLVDNGILKSTLRIDIDYPSQATNFDF